MMVVVALTDTWDNAGRAHGDERRTPEEERGICGKKNNKDNLEEGKSKKNEGALRIRK